METYGAENDRRGIFIISALAGMIGGLCCFAPIVLVSLGLASISVAADLGNHLYGDYRWLFRAVALAFLALALWFYFRSKGICARDQARRQRHRIVNASILVLITAVGVYIFWTYVVLHNWGIFAGLPWAQYDESWAIPTSSLVFGAAFVFYRFLTRRGRRAGAPTSRGDLPKGLSRGGALARLDSPA